MTRDANLFPIGTVVILGKSTAAVMISGYLAESAKMPGYIWDYSGFIYPIGLRDANEVYTFDHSQINQVLTIGYQDGESFAFMKRIKEIAAQMADEMDKMLDSEMQAENNDKK